MTNRPNRKQQYLVTLAIKNANAADRHFEAVLLGYGYSSRWNWDKATDSRPMAAYLDKVASDASMHRAFLASR